MHMPLDGICVGPWLIQNTAPLLSEVGWLGLFVQLSKIDSRIKCHSVGLAWAPEYYFNAFS